MQQMTKTMNEYQPETAVSRSAHWLPTSHRYREAVTIEGPLKQHIVSCYRNHMVVYNNMIEYFKENRSATCKELKTKASEMIAAMGQCDIIKSMLMYDLYNMHKRREFRPKLLSRVQYMTAILSGYTNKDLVYCRKDMTITFRQIEGCIRLPSLLPPIAPGETVYVNISYYGGPDTFEIAVFAMPKRPLHDIIHVP